MFHSQEEIADHHALLERRMAELATEEQRASAAPIPAVPPSVKEAATSLALALEEHNRLILQEPDAERRKNIGWWSGRIRDVAMHVLDIPASRDPHYTASEVLRAVEGLPMNWSGEKPVGGKSEYVVAAEQLVQLTAHLPPHAPVWVLTPVHFYMDDADTGTYSAAVEVGQAFYHRRCGDPTQVQEFGHTLHYQTGEATPYPYTLMPTFQPDKHTLRREIPVLFPLKVTRPFAYGWARWQAAPGQEVPLPQLSENGSWEIA